MFKAGKRPGAIARELRVPLMYVKVRARIRSAMLGERALHGVSADVRR
jgi:hypothetical protein